MKKAKKGFSIGAVAARTGLAVSAIRYYEEQGLVSAERNASGQRVFAAPDIRRLSFVMIAQNMGFSLRDISQALNSLPHGRTPTKRDWEKLSTQFSWDIDARIAALSQLRDNLSSCIGCGCLSLAKCALYNPQDSAQQLGAGPRYLLGDRPLNLPET